MLAQQTLGPHSHAIRIEDQSVAKTLEILEAVAESGKTPRLVKMIASLPEGERSALTAALTKLGTQWIRQPVSGAVTRLMLLRLQRGLSRAQLCEKLKCDISETTLFALEHMRKPHEYSGKFLPELASYFGVPQNTLLEPINHDSAVEWFEAQRKTPAQEPPKTTIVHGTANEDRWRAAQKRK